MTTADIRQIIATAVAHERETGALRARLTAALPGLSERLDIPGPEPVDALLDFIESYIASVPGCLNLVTAVSRRLGFYDYAAPFLHIAEDFFLAPPEDLPDTGGLALLLDEAFLAHRLLEEICPNHISYSGLQAVLKCLLAERVSVKNLNLILEAIAEIAPHARRAEQIAEHVRLRLAQQICGDLSIGGTLSVLRLGNRWELAFHEKSPSFP